MTSLSAIRAGKPAHYPDQAVHCEFAARALGLGFADLDAGTGLLFEIRSADRRAAFGAGRGSFFPQNTATAATLANDKYFANVLMTQAGVPNLGGTYFFLHDRYRSHRAPGRERSDAESYFRALGTHAFIKPLNGSRGDFAQIVDSAEDLSAYLDHVQRYYDAVIMQPVFRGREYRIFMLDDEVVYSVAKETPTVTGDGRASLRDLIAAKSAQLDRHGISAAPTAQHTGGLDVILPKGERFELPGRTNLSAGGVMRFADPADAEAAFALARRAVKALGLRAAAVDMFTDLVADTEPMRVIEINANPSIRFLEDSGCDDLILRIWRHTFGALGLIDV